MHVNGGKHCRRRGDKEEKIGTCQSLQLLYLYDQSTRQQTHCQLDSFPLANLFWTMSSLESAMGGMLAVWFLRNTIILF